ncbi:hypothetical protein GCM10007853_21550 [Algimonas ampicilliniresistens]|uniref:Uncharacterized protein n=1 Tax=Algimonas ampicilliniresistens TaxID=1298735 RepID=A0ABQ5V9P9_9PROT|nr:hypothetical protein GCM10007853_21550 [Algimonas ampicilliniresistens]
MGRTASGTDHYKFWAILAQSLAETVQAILIEVELSFNSRWGAPSFLKHSGLVFN